MEKIRKTGQVAVVQGNFFCMDFAWNYKLLQQAMERAAGESAQILVCPELCIPGPDCEDHFFEPDTVVHSWEILAKLLAARETESMLCAFGMPVRYNNALYDCMVYCYNHQIVLIRPKMILRDSGYVHQSRWFTPWGDYVSVADYKLPECVKAVGSQETCRIGGSLIRTADGAVLLPLIDMVEAMDLSSANCCLYGAEVLLLSAASYHEVGRHDQEAGYLQFYSKQVKTVVAKANPVGCDGTRLYYDGGAAVWLNGELVAAAPRFSLEDCKLAFANIDLEEIRTNRVADKAWGSRTGSEEDAPETQDIELVFGSHPVTEFSPSKPMTEALLPLHEELALASGNWMWDFARRSGAGGFFIPLSGGADSSTCATLLGLLGERLCEECKKGNKTVAQDLERMFCEKGFIPATGKDVTKRLLYTAYLGTTNSSKETRVRAKAVADSFGVTHIDGTIDAAVEGLKATMQKMTGITPKFESAGGSKAEDIALQNVQARSRLILSYFVAQVLPAMAKRSGFFFVVATGNGDECIRGYFTKYDNSSGDMDPIGSWSKQLVNAFLEGWMHRYPVLKSVREATPSAELKPLTEGKQMQTDEADMGFTYSELALLGKVRKVDKCGPVSMFEKLVGMWPEMKVDMVAEKVKRFFRFYSINRHKMASLPPGLHSTEANCDDNRFDQRQILYNTTWEYQFKCLDEIVEVYKKAQH